METNQQYPKATVPTSPEAIKMNSSLPRGGLRPSLIFLFPLVPKCRFAKRAASRNFISRY